MSQEELATRTEECDSVSWFRKKHPHFFTPKVVAARTGNSPVVQSLLREPEQYWRSVSRKLDRSSDGSGRRTFVELCMDKTTRSFKFMSKLDSTDLPIDRSMILNAVTSGHGEWVGIKIGAHVLRLNRAELKAAFHALDKLP